MIDWVSEGTASPVVGQSVLVAKPRQFQEWRDISVGCILIRHEGVPVLPVKAGTRWPTNYYWSLSSDKRSTSLVTGNAYCAALNNLPLPLGAEHFFEGEYHAIKQVGECFIPQRDR
jgi:hypothetical protein